MHEQNRIQSRKMALCGVLTALSIVILSAGSLIPSAAVASPMLAMICLVPIHCDYGTKTALLVYTAVSILAALLCTDKELALFYIFLGWYPALRPHLLRFPRFLQILLKCAVFTFMMFIMYAMLIYLFRMQAIVEEFAAYSAVMLASLLILGNVSFLLQDMVLRQMTALYQRRRRR